jgi:hypothetical protein
VGLARVNAMGKQVDQNFVTQDLLFGVGATANEGDVVSVRYIAFPLSGCKLGEVSICGDAIIRVVFHGLDD